MATFRAEVYAHQKKQDGTYNIKIRVTHNRKKKYISTVWFVTSKDVAKTKSKSTLKIKNHLYIDLTDELIRKYRKTCAELGEAIKSISIDRLVDILQSEKKDSNNFDFSSFVIEEINSMKGESRKFQFHNGAISRTSNY